MSFFFKVLFTSFFLERGREGEREEEKHQCVPLIHPQLETWPTTQVCALTGDPTNNPLGHRPALNQ